MNWNQLQLEFSELLCPPGDGVYTVHTASDRKKNLQKKLFGSDDIKTAWQETINQMPDNSQIVMLGIPSDNGGGILRGANWGPLFIRDKLYQNNPELDVFDLGDVRVVPHLLHDNYLTKDTIASCQLSMFNHARNQPVSPLSITERICNDIHTIFPEKKIFAMGGDHSCSFPLVKTFFEAAKRKKQNCALIQFDAHTDLLSQRLGIDICFGSWTYHALKYLPKPEFLSQVGIRSTGKSKQHWQEAFNIHQHWAEEIHQHGPAKIVDKIVANLKALEVEALYITFDIDALDISEASATGTPETGGLTTQQSIEIIDGLASQFPVLGADIMEVAPFVHHPGLEQTEPDTTLTSAANIAACLIGHLQSS